jgi:NAD+ kinase
LGGDGTLLHASSLFQKSCPPVLSFSMGSLGFLTPFDFKNHEEILNEVLGGNVPVLLRTRLSCEIIRDNSDILHKSDGPFLSLRPNDKLTENNNNDDEIVNLSLNEVVIDRGPNSYLSNLDLYINDRFITKVQGDGLVISTPTGSTAYAMAAGASMVHPNVPAMVICPICPHSLSFRPIVVPAGIELSVKVPEDTRLTAWLSIDGRNQHELRQQDRIRITTSVYPVPSICRFDQLGDWFESLADILHWNLREPQLSFDTDRDTRHGKRSPTRDQNKIIEENQNSSDTFAPDSSVDIPI